MAADQSMSGRLDVTFGCSDANGTASPGSVGKARTATFRRGRPHGSFFGGFIPVLAGFLLVNGSHVELTIHGDRVGPDYLAV